MRKSAQTLNNQPQVQSNSHTIYIFSHSHTTIIHTHRLKSPDHCIRISLNNLVMLLLLLLLHQNMPIHLPKSLPLDAL